MSATGHQQPTTESYLGSMWNYACSSVNRYVHAWRIDVENYTVHVEEDVCMCVL